MKYPLYKLDDMQFENLVALICEKILGTGTIVFSTGKDGGRDAKFKGTANKFPSESSPWSGSFIIQAKHTTKPISSCSDSDFQTIVSKEIPKIRELKQKSKIDYYILFTNRKLSGIQDEKLEDNIYKNTNIPSVVLAEEKLQLFLLQHPEISRLLNLNKLLIPLEFFEEDIKNTISAFSAANIKTSKAELFRIQSEFQKIPIEEKNKLNKLGEEYFNELFKRSYVEFVKIKQFLENPINKNYKDKYNNTVNDIQEEIIIKRDEYHNFEEILHHLYKFILSNLDESLLKHRNLIRVFLHYMYYHCDIGKKVPNANS